jgi:predicted  nucleic acid-binding Zn-ribbon protein
MEEFQSGDMTGAGSFRCGVCGFAVSLRERDRLPECPACGGRRFERAPMFGDTVEAAVPDAGGEPPEWLEDVRDGIAEAGDYLAFDDGFRVRTIALGDGWTRIGRSLSAEVRIDDPTVSRRHALVHRDGDVVRVLDDRSLNGIYRNGRRVELDELADGDVVTVGRFEMQFMRLSGDREQMLAGA